jgi:hypothetical protein
MFANIVEIGIASASTLIVLMSGGVMWIVRRNGGQILTWDSTFQKGYHTAEHERMHYAETHPDGS